ncbi:MAG: hypothetical protein GAK43_01612 [Stenotrophomonas maltophilia]|nr:MAG: hypothetical protein GAK43_01612 [Stenotrophomonas maltophilia]
MPTHWRHRALRELLLAGRFAIVGVCATALHMLVVWLLLSYTRIDPLLANLLAFLCAFGLSFSGNYLWTFSAPGTPGKAMQRFFLISLCAFIANSALLALLLTQPWLPPRLAALASASVVPGISFLASRLWGFKY